MPYIEKTEVQRVREQIKKEFPKFKFSITRDHYSSISISILAGNIEKIFRDSRQQDRYEQVNHFYINDIYKNEPDWITVLNRINEIANENNRTICTDGDYGDIPKYYVHINIGKWDKPYIYKP